MNDTTLAIELELTTLFSRLSAGERVKMVCEMFDLARVLMVADIKFQEPAITEADLRVRIFDRLYGSDLPIDPHRA